MIIDGIDILATYSATLLYGSLEDLVAYPSLKKPEVNDWAEYDSLEVDLENPVLDKRGIDVTFLISEPYIDSFVSFLMFKTYRLYYSKDLNVTYKLRCESISDIDKPQGKCSISLKLVDDFPLFEYGYVEPFLNMSDSGFSLDGKNISEYGLYALDGTENGLESVVNAKDKLEINSKFISGVSVSEQQSKKQNFQSIMKFLVKQTPVNFFIGYNAFLYDLVRPNERILTVNGKNYTFYYVGSKVKALIVHDGEVWCNFEIKIEIL